MITIITEQKPVQEELVTLRKSDFEKIASHLKIHVTKMEKTFDDTYKKVKESGADMGYWMWIGHELAHMKYALEFVVNNAKQAVLPTFTIPAENITVSTEVKFNG